MIFYFFENKNLLLSLECEYGVIDLTCDGLLEGRFDGMADDICNSIN